MPFFWAISPNYDLTLTPTLLSRQGMLREVECRHHLINGCYMIHASGIFQNDPAPSLAPPYGAGQAISAERSDTRGEFLFNDKWVSGWDRSASTDKWFYHDYK